jgi:predicted GH43/DUF377 family glycosyl hydrolase
MKSFFFKLSLLIVVLVMSNGSLLAQYEWVKYHSNPLNIHGSSGSWDQSVLVPYVIFNSDLNRYEMWYTAFWNYPSEGIGFAYSDDGITWTKHPTPVMTPSAIGWDSLFVGAPCIIKEGGLYKMWYTGWKSTTRMPHNIGYATSPDGINWTKHPTPVLTPGSGWESGAVGYPSVIKVTGGYLMFYTGETSLDIARTGRAMSSDGITWQKDTANNPVLLPGAPGEWDQNNYLGKVIELNNILYIYYTGELNPGVSGTAIGLASSTDMGITWTKYENNPIITRGTTGQWDNGWIETGSVLFANNQLKLYYDGGGSATGNRGRVGFAISDPLPAGTYTVGTGGNFATIQDAFNKLQNDGVAGNVTFELIDELYTAPTDTFGFKLNGPLPGVNPNSRVTIKPAANKNVLIQGSARDQLSAINTSFVTIDGVSLTGPSTLTFHALYNNQFAWNACINFIDNSDHNIIRNITFISDDIDRGGGGPSLYARTSMSAVADSNLIENNFIKKCGVGGIYLAFDNSNLRGTGNIIRSNFIGSETDSLLGWGIQVEHAQNTIIENNIIQNLKHTPTQVSNIINVGINSYSGLGDIIRNNIIHGVKSSSGYTATGIMLSGGSGINNMVYNNMVYDIHSTSTAGNSRVAGIQIWLQDNPQVYYNTVYLTGGDSHSQPSAAFYVYGLWGTSTNINLKNNIFINTRDDSPYCASAMCLQVSSISTLTSDYNDLYNQSNQYNYLVRILGTDYQTLTDWQLTGNDIHSYVEMPHFISPTDLHIDKAIATYLESRGTPITGIDTDFEGDSRNASTPDIGADEFDGIVGVEDEETLPTEFALEQNYPNPFNPSTTFRYSIPTQSKVVIKVFDILGNEIATLMDEEKSVGTYELMWNAANLSSGIYFYQLNSGNFIETKKMILLK